MTKWRRAIGAGTTLAMAFAAFAVSRAGNAAAQAPLPATCSSADDTVPYSTSDVDGDNTSDIVIGAPSAAVAGRPAAGAVDVHFGDSTVQRLTATHRAAAAGDRFGAALALTHLDSVRCADMVIGAPGADGGRGYVEIRRGHASRQFGAVITLRGRSAGEAFGSAVVASGTDVFVSAPNRTVSGAAQAGAVDHYRIHGSTATLVQSLTESTPGISGLAEHGDHFGQVLDVRGQYESGVRLAIGEPGEDVGRAVDAGTVTVVATSATSGRLTSAATTSQNTAGVPGTAERGDHFGASVSIAGGEADPVVAVGVPGEALGRIAAAGTVLTLRIDEGSGRAPIRLVPQASLTQESPGVPGGSEAGDAFGAAVELDDNAVLRVGVPGEDIGSATDAGDVLTFVGSRYEPPLHYQGGHLPGALRSGARVGSTISRFGLAGQGPVTFGGGDRVLVGIPGADRGRAKAAGEVAEFDDTTHAYVDSVGAATNQRYGVLASQKSGGPVLH